MTSVARAHPVLQANVVMKRLISAQMNLASMEFVLTNFSFISAFVILAGVDLLVTSILMNVLYHLVKTEVDVLMA